MSSTAISKTDTFLDESGAETTVSKQFCAANPLANKLFVKGIRKVTVPPKVSAVVTFQERVQLLLDSQFEHTDNAEVMAQLSALLAQAQALNRQ